MVSFPLPEFDAVLRAACRVAVLQGARYIQRRQVWHTWPYWTADAGRIPHNVCIKDPTFRPTLSLTWDCARSAQALLSAYRLCGEAWMLESAQRAMEYVKVNQIFDPEFPQHRGASREEVPQSNHIAAHRATGEARYREVALRYGEWWLGTTVFPETYAAIPSALLFFLDLYRFTGDRRYLSKAEAYARRTLAFQHLDEKDERLHGGFAGHDGEKGIVPTDFISLRTTMYALMALSKLAARDETEWNMAYSAFGW